MTALSLGAALLGAASVAGILYQIAAARLVTRFMRAPAPVPAQRPPVSVLKPLCGAEHELVSNLRSITLQDYPRFQVVFGLADGNDPARPVAERLVAEGGADAQLVVDDRAHGANLKIANLLNMLPRAKHDVVVIADSDVAVTPRHLDDVVAPLADPSVGIVTCLYLGRPKADLPSRLGALAINHGFLPSALVARALGRHDGCFGATMALRRSTLDAVGGLESLADVLADDWALGNAVRELGLKIGLAARPVDLVVNEADIKSLLAHEIRWGRTIASIDRLSYIASVITQPLALALLATLLGGMSYAGVLGAAALVRLWAIRTEEQTFGLPRAPVTLLALREALSFVVFVAASVGRSVSWRGRRFRVRSDGTMELLEGYRS